MNCVFIQPLLSKQWIVFICGLPLLSLWGCITPLPYAPPANLVTYSIETAPELKDSVVVWLEAGEVRDSVAKLEGTKSAIPRYKLLWSEPATHEFLGRRAGDHEVIRTLRIQVGDSLVYNSNTPGATAGQSIWSFGEGLEYSCYLGYPVYRFIIQNLTFVTLSVRYTTDRFQDSAIAIPALQSQIIYQIQQRSSLVFGAAPDLGSQVKSFIQHIKINDKEQVSYFDGTPLRDRWLFQNAQDKPRDKNYTPRSLRRTKEYIFVVR